MAGINTQPSYWLTTTQIGCRYLFICLFIYYLYISIYDTVRIYCINVMYGVVRCVLNYTREMAEGQGAGAGTDYSTFEAIDLL